MEASYSHPFSLNEFEFGNADAREGKLTLEASEEHHFQRPTAPSTDKKAKMVTGIKREYRLTAADKLEYDLYLSVDGQPLKHHLHCEMSKVE